MAGLLLWLFGVGFLLATFSAVATLVLNEIAWHELEEYCRQRNQVPRFGQIFDRRDPMLVSSEIMQMVATAVMSVALVGWFWGKTAPSSLTGTDLVPVMVALGFALILSGSWIPWAVTRIAAVPFLFHTWRFWWVVSLSMWPLTAGGRVVAELLARASGVPEDDDESEEEAFEDEILSMVSEGEHDGYLEPDARDMIEGVMDLDDYTVTHVMTPRTRVDALEASSSWQQMMDLVVESGRTRIPIYRGSIDNVVGLLYAKDLLRESLLDEDQRRPLQDLLREPLIVPRSMKLDEMLKQFLHGRTHMAIVTDEYEGMAGVVTIEDILEEIVGEILDETDKDLAGELAILNSRQADIKGSLHIERLNHELGFELPDEEEFATVSGLIMSQLKAIPRSGDEVTVGNVQFNILEATRREILSVRVTRLEEDG